MSTKILTLEDIKVVDTHVHLINIDEIKYNWDKQVPHLLKNWDLKLYEKDNPHSHKAIFVEVDATDYVAEKMWIDRLIGSDNKKTVTHDDERTITCDMQNNTGKLCGMVIHIDLEHEEVKKHLNVPIKYKIVGVRHLLQNVKHDDMTCLQPTFISNLNTLGEYKIPFEICIYRPQLPTILQMVKAAPLCTYILDHIGKPFTPDEDFIMWSYYIEQLALHKNIYCKLSPGFMMKGQTIDHIFPYIEIIIRHFGCDRLMVGSDWFFSADVISSSQWYTMLLNIFNKLLLSHDQIHKMFYMNAAHIYKLY